MRIRNLVAVVLFALAGLGVTSAQQRLMQASDLVTLAAGPPDQKIPYGPAPEQFANLRLPKGPGPHPVVIFIHGGCWLSQYDIAHAGSIEQALTGDGYAVWSLEYRRVGNEGGGWPGTFLDIANGADYVKQVASKYSLDLNRVVASGHSAGGEFALWLAARAKIPSSSEVFVANPVKIRGVVALAPAPDLEALESAGTCGRVIDKLIGGPPSDFAARYAAVSPMKLAPIGVPSTLIVGGHDTSFGPNGRSYFAFAQQAGDAQVQLVEAPDAGHFELIAPKTATWSIVQAQYKAMFARIKQASRTASRSRLTTSQTWSTK